MRLTATFWHADSSVILVNTAVQFYMKVRQAQVSNENKACLLKSHFLYKYRQYDPLLDITDQLWISAQPVNTATYVWLVGNRSNRTPL